MMQATHSNAQPPIEPALTRYARRRIRETRRRLGLSVRVIRGQGTSQVTEIANGAELMERLVTAVIVSRRKGADPAEGEGVLEFFEKKTKEQLLALACRAWDNACKHIRAASTQINADQAVAQWAKIDTFLRTCYSCSYAAHMLHIDATKRASKGGAGKRKKQQLPREGVAMERLQAMLNDDPKISATDLAENLIGISEIGFKYRKLYSLASKAKKGRLSE